MRILVKNYSIFMLWFASLFPALIAVLPLFGRGFIPTHDGEYHIIRFWQFYKMLSAGYLFPRWAPDLNSGFGVPVFNFNYPFPNYLGSLFHFLGVSLVDAVKFTLAFGYLSAVLWCFWWLKKLFGAKGAILGAIVFAFVPYWFVDLYVRGSVGEVWAIAWFLLTLASVEYGWSRITALSITLMILSHNILSLLFFPLFIGYMLLRKKFSLVTLTLGLGMAAYFWIPALAERGFVTGLNPVNYADHFPDLFQLLVPSWGTGFSGPGIARDEMSFQLGLVSLAIFVMALFSLARAPARNKRLLAGGIVVYSLAVFFMTPYSGQLWKLFPFLAYLQYPWRLLSITMIVTAFLTGFMAAKLSKVNLIVLTILAIAASSSYVRPVIYEPRSDEYYLSRPNFTDGTSSLGNAFSTIWSPWKSSRPNQRFEVASGKADLTVLEDKPLEYRLKTDSTGEVWIKANILYYPGWEVLVDGVSSPIDYISDGVINFDLPRGTHEVALRFTETPPRKLANTISVICLFWLFGSTILGKARNYAEQKSAELPRKKDKQYLYAHRD